MELGDTENTHKKRAEKGYIYIKKKKKDATDQSLNVPLLL